MKNNGKKISELERLATVNGNEVLPIQKGNGNYGLPASLLATKKEMKEVAVAMTKLQSGVGGYQEQNDNRVAELKEKTTQLDEEMNALPIDNLGKATAISLDMQEWPMLCGRPMTIVAKEPPGQAPDFVGQRWIDVNAKKEYVAININNAGDFVALN